MGAAGSREGNGAGMTAAGDRVFVAAGMTTGSCKASEHGKQEIDMVQIAGSSCRICGLNIATAIEGTWCIKCQSVFHASCLTKADSVCPECKAHYTAPSEADLLLAQGKACRSERQPHAIRLGPMIEILVGAVLIISPIALFFLGFVFRFGGSSGGILIACLLSLIFIILGATLVVDGDKNFRKGV